MNRRIYWGLAILMVLLVGVSVVLLTRTTDTEPKRVYRDRDPSKEVLDNNQPRISKRTPPFHETPHQNDPVVTPTPFPESDNPLSIPERVSKSNDVPQYSELKAMSNDVLKQLMEDSYNRLESLGLALEMRTSEWSHAIDELTRDANSNSEYARILSENREKLKPFQDSMDAATWEYNVSRITGSKAFKVWQWRTIKDNYAQNPNPGAVIVVYPIPEPFDK